MKKYRIAFFGTPEFSVPILKAISESTNLEIPIVVTQPDRPAGRNLKLSPSPVKKWAEAHQLYVLCPESCKEPSFAEELKKLSLDLVVVVAFGQILNQKVLDLLPEKFINIHASLLPHLRGAAPIQRAIMLGDKQTGVSFQIMKKKLDAGDVIKDFSVEIAPLENSISLHNKLSKLAADNVADVVLKYLNKELLPKPQDESKVTYAAKIEKSETWIDWTLPSDQVWNHIRGLALGPGGTTVLNSKRIKITSAQPIQNLKMDASEKSKRLPGQIFEIGLDSFDVVCGQNTLLKVFEVQPESKPVMKVSSFLNGTQLKVLDQFLKPL